MKKLFWMLILPAALDVNAQISYPSSKKTDIVDVYNGFKVEDPYQWLEDENRETTQNWIIEQNKVTFGYLNAIPFRDQVKRQLERLWNYAKYSNPVKKGPYYYYFKNDGLQNQAILYRQKGLDGKMEVFLDPNTLGTGGITAVTGFTFSRSGRYMAYTTAVAGSDWQEIFVMETESRKLIGDKIEWSKFGNAAWLGDDGFYYSGYDKPKEEVKLTSKNESNKIFYHKIGTPQTSDVLIYEDKKNTQRFHTIDVTEDGHFLLLYIYEGTSTTEVWCRDLKDPAQKSFKPLIAGFKARRQVIDNKDGKLIVMTNDDAPNYRVVSVDPKNPAKTSWKTLIAEKPEALQSVGAGGGYLFANYLKNAATKVNQHDYDGNLIREIRLPGIGTADGFGGEKEDTDFFYSYSSFNTPPAIYHYVAATGESSLFRQATVRLHTEDLITEQTFFTSKDGTQVPMFITYKKGLKLDGNNPLLMYGYGGFNVPLTPSFSVSNAFFIENGGVYVVVNLRGGSEFGEKWHEAGMLDKKQNVFDDFIAAAEFLIKRRYTNSQKIAMKGASNGGLLVGAVMTQRPELFKVALPAVGVMDMLRFHKFTIGYLWTSEYGCADSATQFPFLYRYSPYHKLRQGLSYPATLVTTADHDDRVVPAHSFKFAARLQEYNQGPNPVLIRIETNAGHGAGKPTNKQIDEAADTWSFVMQNLGMALMLDDKMVTKDGDKDKQDGKGSANVPGGKGGNSGDSKSTTTKGTTPSKSNAPTGTTNGVKQLGDNKANKKTKNNQ